MSKVYICSDFHLGHKGISSKFRNRFEDDEAHDKFMMDSWSGVVKKRDKVICLGDMAMSKEGLVKIASLPGTKHLVIGNHDTFKTKITIEDLVGVYDYISGPLAYKGFWLSHTPIVSNEIKYCKYGWNIHGHTHGRWLKGEETGNHFEVCPEASDYNCIMYDFNELSYQLKCFKYKQKEYNVLLQREKEDGGY